MGIGRAYLYKSYPAAWLEPLVGTKAFSDSFFTARCSLVFSSLDLSFLFALEELESEKGAHWVIDIARGSSCCLSSRQFSGIEAVAHAVGQTIDKRVGQTSELHQVRIANIAGVNKSSVSYVLY